MPANLRLETTDPETGWGWYLRHLAAVEQGCETLTSIPGGVLLRKQVAYVRRTAAADSVLIDAYAEQGMDVEKAVRCKLTPESKRLFTDPRTLPAALAVLVEKGWLRPLSAVPEFLYSLHLGEP